MQRLCPMMLLAAFALCLSATAASASPPGWLGILEGPAAPTPALAKTPQAATRQEVRLVLPGGPADQAGLKVGDVLLEIAGLPASDETATVAALDGLKVGQAVRVVVLREGKRVEVTATAKERPEPQALVETLRKLGDAGAPKAYSVLGRLLVMGGHGVAKDKAEGVRWFRKAAEQGDATGQNGLGAMYALGLGITKDNAEAVRWFRLAAAQGDPMAQSNLALMYATGRGFAKDDAEAILWFRAAAEAGNAEVQYSLGMIYEDGHGVAKDPQEAARWYRRAADQGYPIEHALERLGGTAAAPE